MIPYQILSILQPRHLTSEDDFDCNNEDDREYSTFTSGEYGEILMYPGSSGDWRFSAKSPWNLYSVEFISTRLKETDFDGSKSLSDVFLLTVSDWIPESHGRETSFCELGPHTDGKYKEVYLFCGGVLAYGALNCDDSCVMLCTLYNISAERLDLGLDPICRTLKDIINMPNSGYDLRRVLEAGSLLEQCTGVFCK